MTSTGPRGTAHGSSAASFHIPLHITGSSSAQTSGPTLPNDWREWWHTVEGTGLDGHKEQDGSDPQDLWPDTSLKRWITCMTAWETQSDIIEPDKVTQGQGQAPNITISEAYGGESAGSWNADARQRHGPQHANFGNRKGGRRIAIGTQDGNVWILQERHIEPKAVQSPASPSSSSIDSPIVRSPSRSSLVFSPSSLRTNANGKGKAGNEREMVTSPTTASIGMSEINASASSLHVTTDMDAEEQLETQWHAGHDRSTMMSGMMEALGMQQQNHSHDHVHHQAHGIGMMSPTSKKHSRKSVDQKARIALGTPPEPRSRATSSVADSNAALQGVGSSIAEAGLIGAIGIAGGRRNAGGAGVQENITGQASDTLPPETGQVDANHSPKIKALQSMEPLISFQCPEFTPISSLTVRHAQNGDEVLCILQKDGRLTIWCLGETMDVHAIDLRRAKVAFSNPDTLPSVISDAAVNVSSSASPFARIAALRSQAVTPVGPRSRTGSNASQVSEIITLPGASKFYNVQLFDPARLCEHLLVTFDATQKQLHVVHCTRNVVIMQNRLSDIDASLPTARIVGKAEALEVYYVNTARAVVTHFIPLKAKVKAPAEVEAHLGPLSTATAFLRREGVSKPASRPGSRPPSVLESNDGCKELGEVGKQSKKLIAGLILLRDELIVAWSIHTLFLCKRVGDSLITIDEHDLEQIQDVSTAGDQIVIRCESSVKEMRIMSDKFGSIDNVQLAYDCDALTASPACATPLSCCRTEEDRIALYCGDQCVWQGGKPPVDTNNYILASLPFNMERIVLSLASGHILTCSLSDLVSGGIKWPCKNDDGHAHFDARITLFQMLVHPKTKKRLILGGSEEGDVFVWDAHTLELQAEHTCLNSPVVGFVGIGDQDNALRLHSCVACISQDGTIAILDLVKYELVFLVPGRDAPLEHMAIRSNDLLVAYADGRARVWDMGTGEMRRSISVDQASALLDDGKGWWSQFTISAEHLKREKGTAGVLSSIPTSRSHLAGAMTADIRRIVEATSKMVAPMNTSGVNSARDLTGHGTNMDDVDPGTVDANDLLGAKSAPKMQTGLSLTMPQARKALHTLRPLLTCFLPLSDVNEEYAELKRKVLLGDVGEEIAKSKQSLIATGAFKESGYLAMPLHCSSNSTGPNESGLCISSSLTTTRLVASIAMLMVLSNVVELEQAAQQLIIMLGALPAVLGQTYQQPTMSVLIAYLTDPVFEIKQAAQTLFVSSLESMPQEELDAVCAEYAHALPIRHQASDKAEDGDVQDDEDAHAMKALLLLGLIATQRYTDLAPGVLKDISSSISLYLNDEQHLAHQGVAITLCERGFTIFQHYFDAMEIVRSLFALSTIIKEGQDTPLAYENRDLARQAVLRIAEENTPLFMTTLSLDILHARSPEHCSATMRLVALMVRRKPLVLYPNLPRLAEAVVKSLDPTITALRTIVHRSATIIISELVTTYPTIAFHKDLQRLAVATFEGAVIMYDLKTATRLYVLEAHSTMLNGLLFSHDGRRLISICLGDGMVKVWRTGVGIGSLFNFGNAPRQMGALLGRAAGFASSSSEEADMSTSNTSSSRGATSHPHVGGGGGGRGGTPAYKSFDFGKMAGPALASVRRNSQTLALQSPKFGGNLDEEAGKVTSSASSMMSATYEQAILSDLNLVRLDWLAERSVRVRIGEASLVFDVA